MERELIIKLMEWYKNKRILSIKINSRTSCEVKCVDNIGRKLYANWIYNYENKCFELKSEHEIY